MLSGVLLAVASAAVAATGKTGYAPDHGTYVYNGAEGHPKGSSDLSRFNVEDTAADHRSVHGNYHWNNGQGGSLPNSAGTSTTVTRETGYTIIAMQACTNGNYGIQPDNCSGWF